MKKWPFILSLLAITFILKSCIYPSQYGPKAKSNPNFYAKYSPYIPNNEKAIGSWYHAVLTESETNEFTFRAFFPETFQLTTLENYKSRQMNIKQGKAAYWFDNGNKKQEGNYLDNKLTGEWIFYHWDTGIISSRGQFVQNKKNGLWKNYDSKERIKSSYNYRYGKKEGVFINYDTLGIVVNEGIYIKDSLISETNSKKVVKYDESSPYMHACKDIVDLDSRSICSTKHMLEYIYGHLKYPQKSRQHGIEGQVIAHFTVSKTGNIEKIEVIQGVCADMKNEVIRVIKGLPKWEPGYQKGKAVNVKYTLPINFRLE